MRTLSQASINPVKPASSRSSSVPAWETTPSPSAVTLIRANRPLRFFIQKVPFREGFLLLEHLKFPLRKGHFRVFQAVRSAKSRETGGLMVSSGGTVTRLSADALFVCIGGVPRTQGAANVGLALDGAGYVRTGAELSSSAGALAGWPLVSSTLTSRNEPARAVRRRRCPKWVDQALRGCDRRGVHGGGVGPPAPR